MRACKHLRVFKYLLKGTSESSIFALKETYRYLALIIDHKVVKMKI